MDQSSTVRPLLVLKYEMPQEFLHLYQNGNPTDFGIDYSVIAYAVELDGERLFYEIFSDECKKPALVVSPGRSFHLMSIKPPPWPLQTGNLKSNNLGFKLRNRCINNCARPNLATMVLSLKLKIWKPYASKTFFDPVTFTLTYLVWHSESKDAAIIDSVLDFDSPSENSPPVQ